MFQLNGSRNGTNCDGASRRDFLKVGALGLGGFLLPDLLRARARAAAQGQTTRNTSVVWLWLGGGPTQIETFDPKPDAPVEFRSTVGQTPTCLPGVQFSGVFPKLAQNADKLAVVRSFAHSNSGHGGGTHWVMTGYNFPQADNGGGGQNKPGIGAIVSRYRGANNPGSGLPTYVRFGGTQGDGPSWLGAPYAPFDVAGNARNDMNLQMTLGNLADRRSLLKGFDDLNRDIDRTGGMRGLDSFDSQAFDLVLSKARDSFDVNREDPRVRDRYGKGLGEHLLTARRLCESGVGFVTVHFGGWDMHGGIVPAMKNLGPQVDHAVNAFLEDTTESGLDQDILLVVTGEFGRTPRVNAGAGRDHWAPLSTLCLAGGGLKMGQIVGESTAKAETPKTTPVSPQDLMATVFHVLGLPQDLQYRDPSGRPTSMIDGGKPIAELV